MITNFDNKYTINLTIYSDNETIDITSVAVSEYTIAKNPLVKSENIHKISFIDIPNHYLTYLQEYNYDTNINIKVIIKNITTNINILNNVFRIINIGNIKDGPSNTCGFDLFLVSLISYKMRRENLLSQITLSEDETNPIKDEEFNIYKLFTLFKEKLIERHGNSLDVILADKSSSSNFMHEYIKLPSHIKDIDAFKYINKQYQGYFFPQYFFFDDMSITKENKLPNIIRQFDLGFSENLTEIDIWSEENIKIFDNIRRFILFTQSFHDKNELMKEIEGSLQVVKHNTNDDIRVFNKEATYSIDTKILMNDDDIIIEVDNVKNIKQKNFDIINSFSEFEKLELAKRLFLSGGKHEVNPQLETWQFSDVCPYHLNFGYRYNLDKNDVFKYLPIDINYTFKKENNERDTFYVEAVVSFFVTPATNLLNELLSN